MTFKLDKGVHIQKDVYIEDPLLKEAFETMRIMEVGDSFLIPCGDVPERARSVRNRVLKLAANHINPPGRGRYGPDYKMFSTRIVAGGVRVWRVRSWKGG